MRGLARAVGALACALIGALAAPALGASATAAQRSRAAGTSDCRGAYTLPTPRNLKLIDGAVVCLIDRERVAHRLAPLHPNATLQQIATSQSHEMQISGRFGDDSIAGRTPWQRVVSSPYARRTHVLCVAQNVGWGTDGWATPAGIVAAWMESPPHRQIILTGILRDIGAGAAPAAPFEVTRELPSATYTVEFAARD